MNLADTIRLYFAGTSEGAKKAWDTRGRRAQSYTAAKGVDWETVGGYNTKTGSKEAMTARLKLDYFVKTQGFQMISEKSSKQGFLWMKEPYEAQYRDNKGNQLTVAYHPDKQVVNAHLDGDEASHNALNAVLNAKNFNKMNYDLYRNEWMNDPRRKAVVG